MLPSPASLFNSFKMLNLNWRKVSAFSSDYRKSLEKQYEGLGPNLISISTTMASLKMAVRMTELKGYALMEFYMLMISNA